MQSLMPDQFATEQEKALSAIKAAMHEDQQLRDKYQIGDKFNFIHQQLQHYIDELQASVVHQTQEPVAKTVLAHDECIVYVYLFNAHGMQKKTWQKMLNQHVLHEYSVNRPIYLDKQQVESFINSKANRMQHAYLAIAIKKEHIVAEEPAMLDSLGQALIKIKEGALQFHRLMTFHYNGHDYGQDELMLLQ